MSTTRKCPAVSLIMTANACSFISACTYELHFISQPLQCSYLQQRLEQRQGREALHIRQVTRAVLAQERDPLSMCHTANLVQSIPAYTHAHSTELS